MHNYSVKILTGLSLQVGGIVFTAVIDEAAKSVRITQQGDPLNGEAAAATGEAINTLVGACAQGGPIYDWRSRHEVPNLRLHR